MTEPATSLPISSLVANPDVWPRQSWDEERVALFADLYAADGPDALPPIVVVPRGDKYLIADGWTRARAAMLVKLAELPAKVVPPPEGADPVDVAYCLALESAASSARPLTRSERHAAVVRLLAATLSDREIAKLVGVAHTTVSRIRKGQNASREREPGEEHLAWTAAEDLAARLFRSLEKVYEARGLTDAFLGDRTAERLAGVLRDAFGDDGIARAQRYRTWIDGAIERLRAGA